MIHLVPMLLSEYFQACSASHFSWEDMHMKRAHINRVLVSEDAVCYTAYLKVKFSECDRMRFNLHDS